MNAIAAAPGWRALAIWAMPPVAYALASDTLIGVVRAWVIARQKALDVRLADDQVTPLAVLGRPAAVAAAPGARAGFDAGRVPPLGDRGMPGRAGPPARHPAASPGDLSINAEACPARPAERHEDGPVPRPGGRAPRRRWQPCRSPTCRGSAPLLRPRSGCTPDAARTALRKAVLAEQNGSRS